MFRLTRYVLQPARVGHAVAPIRYVASDMDGTILGAKHTLSDFTKRTLFALTQELKVPFIFATGRLHADVAVVNENLQEFFRETRAAKNMGEESSQCATPVYLITSNGALIHNARTKDVILEECLPEDVVRDLYALLPASETRINTNLCQRDRWYCRMDWEEMLQFHKESQLRFQVLEKLPPAPRSRSEEGNDNRSASNAPVGEPSEGDVSKVTKVFFTSWDKPLLDKLESMLHARYDDRFTVSYSASYCVDITSKSATKANALRTVLSLLPPQIRAGPHDSMNAEQEAAVAERMRHTVSFGNDLNDASMLLGTGQGFLTANSNPRLLEKCSGLEVIGDHDDDGVAKKLCELFSIKFDA